MASMRGWSRPRLSFPAFPFVFFLTQQQLRPPSSFSSSCHHLQVPILLFLIPNPTQTVLLHPLFDVSPPPPRGRQISAPLLPRGIRLFLRFLTLRHPNQPSEPTHSITRLLPTASSCRALGNITPLCLQKSSSLSLSPHQKRCRQKQVSSGQAASLLVIRQAPPSPCTRRPAGALHSGNRANSRQRHARERPPRVCVCVPASAPAWAKKTSKEGSYC